MPKYSEIEFVIVAYFKNIIWVESLVIMPESSLNAKATALLVSWSTAMIGD